MYGRICAPEPPGYGPTLVDDPVYGAFSVPIVSTLRLTSPAASATHWTTWGKGSVNNNGGQATPISPITLGPWQNPLTPQAVSPHGDLYRLGAQSRAFFGTQADSMTIPVRCVCDHRGSE